MEEMDDVPPTDQYIRGLRLVEKSLHPNHRAMLMAHYKAKGHTLTATELAEAAGYANWRGVNLQYGLFADRLAKAMNWQKPDDAQYSYAIASFSKPTEREEDWLWHMHPQLVKAIEHLGWG